MALLMGKQWTKGEILSFVGDIHQIAGAQPCVLTEGKADGVRSISVKTGGGLAFTVLPGRAMDIPHISYKGKNLNFFSNTGIVSPAYYEEAGLEWLRSFYAGLLTTCGITYSGAPNTDQGIPLGLHGRVSNAGAEDIGIQHLWEDDEYRIILHGVTREAAAMGESLVLRRTIETRLGWKHFILSDVIENQGFEPQPLMMLYHFNFGFPLLGPNSNIVGPILKSSGRDNESGADNIAECLSFPDPIPHCEEQVFFHDMAVDADKKTFIALLNRDVGDGTPLGIVMRYNKKELPQLTEWKMPRKGFYALGLEPGTAAPMGRAVLREQGKLQFIEAQSTYNITIEFRVLDSLRELDMIEEESSNYTGG